jgi:SAM-dependent methyltransferase
MTRRSFACCLMRRSRSRALDIACGPGSVVAAFAARLGHAVGLDATAAMLDEAQALAQAKQLENIEWRLGDVYALPFADEAFDIVTCRFAFHHFEAPEKAFAEMVRVCRSSGRILLCDGVASADPDKAAAFNTMECHRDPSTAAFRPLSFLIALFRQAGLPEPTIRPFQVVYAIDALIARSFPLNDDRTVLRRMIDRLVADDALDIGTRPGGESFIYPAVVLTATKPA